MGAWRSALDVPLSERQHVFMPLAFPPICRNAGPQILGATGISIMQDHSQYSIPTDYLKFYDLEHYLFTEVGGRFRRSGTLSSADFYMIIIWKANRAKSRIRNRLSKHEGGFAGAVEALIAALRNADGPAERMEILMKTWRFRLPMATAILTVLYPHEFTVYDMRVCEQLGAFEGLGDRQFSETLWDDYCSYMAVVSRAAPSGLSLRDKDRFLWARSFYEGVMKDLEAAQQETGVSSNANVAHARA